MPKKKTDIKKSIEPDQRLSIEVNDIEVIKNEYFNDEYIIPKEEMIYKLDVPKGRIYASYDQKQKKIEVYASTTTIIQRYSSIDFFLFKWWCDKGYEEGKRIFEEAGQYGTFQHIVLKNILTGQEIDISEIGLRLRIMKYCEFENINFDKIDSDEWIKKSKQDTLGIIKWVQDKEIEPIGVEITLYSKAMKYAGTLDMPCLARLKKTDKEKTRILVDYKTGRNAFYDDYPIQLKSYVDLWNENYPDRPIERFFNLGAKDFRIPLGDSVIPYRWQEQTNADTVRKWKHYLAMYLEDIDDFKPEPKWVIKDSIINSETNINDMFIEENSLENLKTKIEKAEEEF